MLLAMLNLTQVLVVGVPAYIGAIFAGIAMLRGGQNRAALKTPSGDTLGVVAERAHDTGIANNLLLRNLNGDTQPAGHEQLHAADAEPPHVPADTPEAAA